MRKIDFHVHINCPIPIEKTVENFKDMAQRFGYEGVGIMALNVSSCGLDPECNARAIALKRRMPGSYAFAALDHGRDFLIQAEEYRRAGFDGIKLLEGKPSLYRYYGYGLENERFDAFFAYAEREQLPILLHNCDPALHWDITRLDDRAKRLGWYYDASMPPQDFFSRTLEQVLEKYPALRLTVAHLGFYADRLEIAARLLERCPNLYFDITPALIIYTQLSENADAPAFFRKYGDRLIYGTDAENDLTGFARAYNDKKVQIITSFLEKEETCEVEGVLIHPIAAEQELLRKIYAENALRFIMETPWSAEGPAAENRL